VRAARRAVLAHYQAFGFASKTLVNRFYAQCTQSAHVKRDYLNRLAMNWYRLDTI